MKTRISATADWPCDASCQPKCCQLLHNCRNKLYNKSTTIEAMESEVGRRVGNKPRRVNESTCPGEIFQVQSLAQSYRENYPYFGRYPNFIIIQRGIDGRKRPCQKPARFVQLFRYHTRRIDERRDTRRHHIQC